MNHFNPELLGTRALRAARLKHRLELQSRQIEAAINEFSYRQLPDQGWPRAGWPTRERTAKNDIERGWAITGGHAGPDELRYDLPNCPPGLSIGSLSLRALEHALAIRLQTAVRVQPWGEGLSVTVQRDRPPVDLLTLLRTVGRVGALTAVLGLDAAGQAVTLNLPAAGHLLVAGDPHSGKTSLLHTLALSLILYNRPSRLQFLLLAAPPAAGARRSSLDLLHHLPPAYLHPASVREDTPEAAAAALEALPLRAAEPTQPHIVVLLDDLDRLLETAQLALFAPLIRLLAVPGAYSLVMSTHRPEDSLFQHARGAIGARIIGRIAAAAQAAAGFANSQADRLPLEGGFFLTQKTPQTGQPDLRRFQAAFIDPYDTSFLLQQIYSATPTRFALTQPQRQEPSPYPLAQLP